MKLSISTSHEEKYSLATSFISEASIANYWFKALSALDCINQEPTNPFVWTGLAEALLSLGFEMEALKILKALSNDPCVFNGAYDDPLFKIGAIYALSGDIKIAEKYFNQCRIKYLSAHKNIYEVYFYLGVLAHARGAFADARNLYKQSELALSDYTKDEIINDPFEPFLSQKSEISKLNMLAQKGIIPNIKETLIWHEREV
jgi:tetratricopeptide (TPR) repeat protein